jgi:hypothetical protein
MNALSCGGYATVQDAAMLALADARFSKSDVLVYLAVLRGEQLDKPPSARDLQLAYSTTRDAIDRLVEAGLLSRVKQGRSNSFEVVDLAPRHFWATGATTGVERNVRRLFGVGASAPSPPDSAGPSAPSPPDSAGPSALNSTGASAPSPTDSAGPSAPSSATASRRCRGARSARPPPASPRRGCWRECRGTRAPPPRPRGR